MAVHDHRAAATRKYRSSPSRNDWFAMITISTAVRTIVMIALKSSLRFIWFPVWTKQKEGAEAPLFLEVAPGKVNN